MAEIYTFPDRSPQLIASTQPPDAAARASALDVRRSWIVEAPAGSGKTGLIIQRYLKLLADESVDDPGQVLAITFTRKATFELQDRVLAQLKNAADGANVEGFDAATLPLALAVLERDRKQKWNLLEHPRRLNIRTIDSVCSEIAGSLPILSRSGGAVQPSDDAVRLYAEAARRTTSHLGGPDLLLNDALRAVLLHRDGNLRDCESLISNMLSTRDQWGELVPLARAELDEAYLDRVLLPKFERALDTAICTALTRVTHSLPPDVLSALCELAAAMAHLEGYDGDPSPLAICTGRAAAPGEKAAHLSHWRVLIDLLLTREGSFRKTGGLKTNTVKFMIEATHRKQLGALIDRVRSNDELRNCLCDVRNLPPAEYPPEQWLVAKALFRVLGRALIELQLVFSERGECDFAELGLLARAALRHEGALDALRSANGHSLQHLLVDEMQDTSSSQYELIELLTQGWDGQSQTVFLVGDPKQSIYMFRQARVERFVRTMQRKQLGDLSLDVLQLTANFRSQAKLVQNFNEDFARIFPPLNDPLRPERVAYRHADAVLAPSPAKARIWHTSVLPYIKDSESGRGMRDKQRQEFAFDIRRIAATWRTRTMAGRQPSLAVLVRSRKHLLSIIQAFKHSSDAGPIPYRAVEIESLGERQEVLDILALTRALLHPADRTAWFAVLRSPFCGLTLADLHRLAGTDQRDLRERTVLDLMETRGDLLSEDGIARLKPLWSVLAAALAQRGTMRLSQWIDRTIRALNGYAFADQEACDNVGQFLHLLDVMEEPGATVDIVQLQNRLSRLYAAPSVHPGAIDLMTIHGAKGLEWDVVFVPALERVGQRSRNRLLTWLELDGDLEHEDSGLAHGILAPIQSKGAASQALNRWMRGIESEREAAEQKRLFYVACTRAREELHLFASPERSADGNLRPSPTSLLASAWPAAEAYFVESTPEPKFEFGGQLAASEEVAPARQLPTVSRIPLSHLSDNLAIRKPDTATPSYQRPDGSFAARSFGNTVHAFLQQCSALLATGTSAETLLAELPLWGTRIANVIRASGLPTREVKRQADAVLQSLAKTLADPHGRWILSPHTSATSEAGLISWQEQRLSLRLDRTFLAGPEPISSGSSHLWVIDFKTSAHGQRGLQDFLAAHHSASAPQLEFYANRLAAEDRPIRLALYYPQLSALDWWAPEER